MITTNLEKETVLVWRSGEEPPELQEGQIEGDRVIVVIEAGNNEPFLMFAKFTSWLPGWVIESDSNWPSDCVLNWAELPTLYNTGPRLDLMEPKQ